MDFGRLDAQELTMVDFTLPGDGELTNKTFTNLKGSGKTCFHLGTPRWGDTKLNGIMYPIKTKQEKLISEYSKIFNSIELNATFYGIPRNELMAIWAKEVKKRTDFLFCPKVSNSITHRKKLIDVEQDMHAYLSAVSEFGSHLGPIFIQIGDNLGPKNYLTLEKFLLSLPADKRFFLELRHEAWFDNKIARKQIFSLLSELNIGAVITDTAGRRDVVHMELPIPEVFIRFVGNGRARINEDQKRIDEWVGRIKSWQSKGLQKVFFFIHQLEVGYSIEMKNGNFSSAKMTVTSGEFVSTLNIADYTIKQFNTHLNANLPELKFIQGSQPDLF